jgi:hypothetical protein
MKVVHFRGVCIKVVVLMLDLLVVLCFVWVLAVLDH